MSTAVSPERLPNGARLPLSARLAALLAITLVALLVWPGDGLGPAPGSETRALAEPTPAAAMSERSALPLLFVPNRGQSADPATAFVVQGGGASLAFRPDGVTYLLRGTGGRPAALRLTFPAGRRVAPVGEARGTAVVSYFTGPPADWITGVPTYTSIVYRDLWPGIDLVFSGDQRVLKYAFRVAPGADASQIGLAYRGHEQLSLRADGSLAIATAAGVVVDAAPSASQAVGDRSVAVPVAYRLDVAAGLVSLDVGAHDPGAPLLIDPAQLLYAGYVGGGSGAEEITDIAVDPSGSAYVVGYTESPPTEFPDGDGFGAIPSLNSTLRGSSDAFVVKVDPAGTAIVYAAYIGGAGGEAFSYPAVAVDAAGSAYITGWTSSDEATFPIGSAFGGTSFDATQNGATDAYLVKLAPSGTAIAYSGFIGGSGDDYGIGVAVDPTGNAYVAGHTYSGTGFAAVATGFDPSFNDSVMGGGGGDGFLVKVNAAGTAIVYGGYIGGGGADDAQDVGLDAAGNAYVAGLTGSAGTPGTGVGVAGFPNGDGMANALGACTIPSFDCTENGLTDAFVVKVISSGTSIAYAGFIGGGDDDSGLAIAVDGAGAAYVAGSTDSPQFAFPNGNGFGNSVFGPDTFYNGSTDGFVAKIVPTGLQLAYAGYVGGSAFDRAWGIAVDASGGAYVVGETQSDESTFPDGDGIGPVPSFDPSYNVSGDAFLVRVTPAGTAFDLAGYLGGDNDDAANAVAVDAVGSAYVVGRTGSGATTFPTGTGVGALPSFDPTGNGGSQDGFVVKLATAADLSLAATVASPSVAVGQQVPVTLTAANGGPAAVSAAAISVPVPQGATVAAATSSQGSCSVAQAVSCALGPLAVGAKATVALTLVAAQAGTLGTTAGVASEYGDPNPQNNQAAFQAVARVPGGLALGKAKVKATWKVSRLSGAVTLTGSLAEPVTLTVALARAARSTASVAGARGGAGAAKPCRLAVGRACTLALAAGQFATSLPLVATLLPGRYELRVTGAAADGLTVPAQALVFTIPKPAEGVVDRVWVSVQKNSSPRSGVPRTAKQFFVHFRFAALPKKRQLVLVIRYPDGERRVITDFLAARLVEPRQPGPLLPGKWAFTLTSGKKAIARTTVKVT